MKKVLVTFLFILLNLISYGQVKGVDFSKAISPTSNDPIYEVLLNFISDGEKNYMIVYSTTPVGLKHCIEKARELASLNNLDFDQPNKMKDELIADYIDGITDYGDLSTSLQVGSSEIKRVWKVGSGEMFALFLTSETFAIFFYPANK